MLVCTIADMETQIPKTIERCYQRHFRDDCRACGANKVRQEMDAQKWLLSRMTFHVVDLFLRALEYHTQCILCVGYSWELWATLEGGQVMFVSE